MTTLRILIVDDDPSIVELLTEYLRTRGHEVRSTLASGPVETLLGDAHLDVALIDLGLPDADGLEVLAALRDRAPELAVVMMTGRGDIAPAIHALKAGASDFLLKPFRLRDVHDALVNAVEANQRRLRTVQLQGVVELAQAARTSSPRGLGGLLRYAGPLIRSDLDAEAIVVALYEPAVKRWVELSRSGDAALTGLDLDALGERVQREAPLGDARAGFWFDRPHGWLSAAPIHVQRSADGRPEVCGFIASVTERESRRAQSGLEVYGGVLGDTLTRHALSSLLRAGDGGGAGQRVYGQGQRPSAHRQLVEGLIEAPMRTLGFSPQERMAVDHALDAWTTGASLRGLLNEPESLNERLDPKVARLAAEMVLGMRERFGGHGSPKGLTEREIPHSACLLAIADWWALTTRTGALLPAMSVEEARATLDADRGRRFSPQVAPIFLRHVSPGARSQDTMLPFEADEEPSGGAGVSEPPSSSAKTSLPWFRRR